MSGHKKIIYGTNRLIWNQMDKSGQKQTNVDTNGKLCAQQTSMEINGQYAGH